MAYTVGQVSRIARVSVRALHHWDELGLIKPSQRSPKGYRLYTDGDLDRLQQVLFYRELGLPLEVIAATLRAPDFEVRRALESHRRLLAERVERAQALLALVDRTLTAMDGGHTMTPEEKFEPFNEQHEAEARERWGTTAEYAEAMKRTKRYTKEDWARQQADWRAIMDRLAALAGAGVPPSDDRATAIAEEHRAHIERWFYPCSRVMHGQLGEMYVADPRFTATHDAIQPGLAGYLRDAIASVR